MKKNSQMQEIHQNIRTNLKNLRLLCGYKQKDVAKLLGLGRTAYLYIEKGKNAPDIYYLFVLAQLYNVSVDSLCEPMDLTTTRKRAPSDPCAMVENLDKFSIEERNLIAACRKKGISSDDLRGMLKGNFIDDLLLQVLDSDRK